MYGGRPTDRGGALPRSRRLLNNSSEGRRREAWCGAGRKNRFFGSRIGFRECHHG